MTRVLVVHAFYRQRGGEDQVVEDEVAVLTPTVADVRLLAFRNDDWSSVGGLRLLHHPSVTRLLLRNVEDFRPDVVHFHNTFPTIPPGSLRAVKRTGVPVVMTLHNFRLLCVNAVFLRDGEPCTRCVDLPAPTDGVRFACYRDSRIASAGVAAYAGRFRALHDSQPLADRFLVLSEVARRFLAPVLGEQLVEVKPNAVHPDPGHRSGPRSGFVYVGRLSADKGVGTLLEAWTADLPELELIGDGPMAPEVARASAERGNIVWRGAVDRSTVFDRMGSAAGLVFPSHAIEGLPMTVIEAFAVGTPVIATDHGVAASVVGSEQRGLLVPPHDPPAIRRAVERLVVDEPLRASLGRSARAAYEEQYTGAGNAVRLRRIYDSVVAAAQRQPGAPDD